ncbi:hypothetical protein EYB53_020485 [Candidatus Chloroploca sp. M-50]|uniref:Ig-like domain-containing protein n=1 Tax=Candidatus Chloroploca mongolica TaxID=2528176 RepID=A0ABS4DFA2_9CHLR|nr:hypothetical protein [Candidatus Chloroploca mongolica]MBP1468103.1 hypothetical protein [Candidatus Chloroploca mongolica]
MARLTLIILLAVTLALSTLPPAAASPQPNALAVLALQTLPASSGAQLGGIAVGGRTVSVAADNGTLWRKADAALSFGPPTLEPPPSLPTATRVALSALPDGGAYLVWADLATSTITGRSIDPSGSLGPPEPIHNGDTLPVALAVAATADGTVVVVWRDPERLWYRSRSPATGGAWGAPVEIPTPGVIGQPLLATGPSGRIGLVFGTTSGAIQYGEWDGQSLGLSSVTTNSGGEPFDANPSLTYLPDGTPLVAWHRIGQGLFAAQRQADGTWTATRLTDSAIADAPSVAADELGNVVYTWIDERGSLFVAYQSANGGNPWTPLVLSGRDGVYFKVQAVANVGERSFVHVAAERFNGSGLVIDYLLLSPHSTDPGTLAPIIENGATIVGPRPTLTVSFNVTGDPPTELRWRWGVPPTDTASDSDGWVPFSNPIAIPAPSPAGSRECSLETLYTQVRNGDTVQAEILPASITIDQRATGTARLSNPFLPGRVPNDPAGAGGAPAGDPGYTRAPLAFVEVDGTDDCSGLRELQIGTSPEALGDPIPLVGNTLAEAIALPDPSDLSQGTRTIIARLTDQVGNQIDATSVITFDSIRPVVAAGAELTLTPDPQATILADLRIENLEVTDAYPGGYWGAWIASSLTPVADPATSPALTWTAMPIPTADRSADGALVRRWSLATGLATPARELPVKCQLDLPPGVN